MTRGNALNSENLGARTAKIKDTSGWTVYYLKKQPR